MATYPPITVACNVDACTAVRVAVKEIVASIKRIDGGAEEVPNDVQLFSDGVGEPSPVDMDSLDVLDLKERFDPDGERLEALLNGEVDLQELGNSDQDHRFRAVTGERIYQRPRRLAGARGVIGEYDRSLLERGVNFHAALRSISNLPRTGPRGGHLIRLALVHHHRLAAITSADCPA